MGYKKVFIHGLFGSPEDFSKFDFKDSIYLNLVDFDCNPLNFKTLAKKIFYYLSSLSSGPFDLVGYSMGGRIALHLKIYYPHFFRKVIVIGSQLNLDAFSITTRALWQIKWELFLSFIPLKKFLKLWYDQEIFNGFNYEKHLSYRLKIDKQFHQKCLNTLNLFHQNPLEHKIEPYKDLILFLYGENDLAYRNYYHHLSKKGYLCKSIKNASHPLHLQQPLAFSNIIEDFL